MWPNPQFPADLVTFTEEILNGKLHFLCSGGKSKVFSISTSSIDFRISNLDMKALILWISFCFKMRKLSVLLVYSMILLVSTKRCFKENKQISSKVKFWISIEKCSFLNQWQELLIAILFFYIKYANSGPPWVFRNARPCCTKQEMNWK